MSSQELSAKEVYFREQALLDLSDDEQGFSDESFDAIDRALADSKAMPPPNLANQTGSFLGPTPKERQAAFETYTTRQRATRRQAHHNLIRSSTAPEPDDTKTFPATKTQSRLPADLKYESRKKLRRFSSLPDLSGKNHIPFYQRVGILPRELKSGKKVKLADNIKLEPEHRQLLRGKIVYFYPNDDISTVRRTRIHKVIQLGAAWVNRWRDDITHVILDDASHTYSQLLRHLNQMGLPVGFSSLPHAIGTDIKQETSGFDQV